ncbi:hypothetical protein ECANGB1_315 [Enterospora canceri]|uniref:Uncharacterized protein n=1 Tax=Enterospora canceri TaxID=1081671 RepID=A0A1Y1S851_9MICR|nr:hypothetical protein ECANGB1_315 [Enterospora canceri]
MLLVHIILVLTKVYKIVTKPTADSPYFLHGCFWHNNIEINLSIKRMLFTNDAIELDIGQLEYTIDFRPYENVSNNTELVACKECIESFRLISEWYFSSYNSLELAYCQMMEKPTLLLHMDTLKLHGQYFVLPTKNKYVITFQEDGMRYFIGMDVRNNDTTFAKYTYIRFHKIHFTTDGISSLIITKYTTHRSNSRMVFHHPMLIRKDLLSEIFNGFTTSTGFKFVARSEIEKLCSNLKNKYSTLFVFDKAYTFQDINSIPVYKLEKKEEEKKRTVKPVKEKKGMLMLVILLGILIVITLILNIKIKQK